jgi:hypothetical protein
MEITEEIKRTIWEKAIIDDKYPSEKVRKDACGAFIVYDKFGARDSLFGWEIDHIYPASKLKEGNKVPAALIDDMRNLRPLNWKNNASKGTDYPFYTASLVADDENATNVTTDKGKVVNEQVQAELRSLYKLDNPSDDGSGL